MRRRPRARRGALLLETMLSIALFVGAAAFCITSLRSLFDRIERADARQQAVDLARSKMAELEAGLINVQSLRGEWSGAVGSRPDDEIDAGGRTWAIDATTVRTEFAGLSLVELTVTAIVDGRDGESFTLRQLVALREADAEAYEPDDLLEGLPAAAEPRP